MSAQTSVAKSEPFYIGGPYPDGSYAVCETETGRVVQMVAADSDRLKSAAPWLLAALQSIEECCNEDRAARDYTSRQTEIRGIARAAIAKATEAE